MIFCRQKGESRLQPGHRKSRQNRGPASSIENGEALAISTPVKSIWAIPGEGASGANGQLAPSGGTARVRRRGKSRSASPTPAGTSFSSNARSRRRLAEARSRACTFPDCFQKPRSTAAITRAAKVMAHALGFTGVGRHRSGGASRLEFSGRARGQIRQPPGDQGPARPRSSRTSSRSKAAAGRGTTSRLPWMSASRISLSVI